MENGVPTHFHKTDRISEKDLIPNDTVLDALPTSALEGERIVIENNGAFSFYQFVKGAWQLINGNITVEKLEKTVTPIGSFAVGDLLVKIGAYTNKSIFRSADGSEGWSNLGDFGTTGQPEWGQRFKAPFDFTLTSALVYLEKSGSPSDNVVCKLYSGTSQPTTLVATSSNSIAGSSIGASFQTFNFNQALSGGTYYWLVMDRSGSNDNTNFFRIRKNDGSSLSNSSVISLWPETKSMKSDSFGNWTNGNDIIYHQIKGNITGGYYKWQGARSNVYVEPVGIVTSVNGSSATITITGIVTGLSGLTEGTLYSIGGCKIGIALSATELMVFTRKPFTYTGLLFSVTSGYIYFPLGMTPLTTTKTNSPTIDLATNPGEIKVTTTGANTTMNFTNEYEAI